MAATFRRSTDYPCSFMGCEQPGAWVETRKVRANGQPASLGFYGWCDEHSTAWLDSNPEALQRLRELRDLPARIPELRRQAVGELLAQGWSRRQIAAELGITRQSVYEWGK